jgi:hypothetical protein
MQKSAEASTTAAPPPAVDYADDRFSNGRRRPCPRETLPELTEAHPQQLDVRNVTAGGDRYVPLLDQQRYK